MTFSNFLEKVFNNWQAKLISFGFALLLYFGFQIRGLETKDFSIDLDIQEGGDYILVGNAPSLIRIEATGTEEEIAALQKEDFYAYIDSSLVTNTGISKLPVKINLKNDAALSKTIDIKVYPDTVALDFEEKIIKWVPVIPLFIGVAAEGYHQTNWESEPSDIKITGPKSIIDATSFIYADSVDLNEKTNSFTTEVVPTIQNKRVSFENPESLIMSVKIEPQISNRVYTIPIPTTTLSREFVIAQNIPSVVVELSGEMNFIKRYYPGSEIIEADFSAVTKPGTYTIPITTNILPAYQLESIDKTEITVEIIESPEITIDQDIDANKIVNDYLNQGV